MSSEKVLPEGWVWTTLGDIIVPGRISIRPGELPELPYIGLEHVQAETMKLLGTGLAAELKSNALHFWPNDVLYARLRPYLNKVLQPDFEGVCSPEFLIFRQSANLSSSYLQYFLNAQKFKEFASGLTTGERPRADWDQLKDFKFPLAPLLEQQRIVETVEEHLSLLDDSSNSLQKDKIRLKHARESLLKYAVDGKMTEEWREENPAEEAGAELLERILKERRAKWEAEELRKMKERGIVPKDDKWKEKYKEPIGPDIEGLPELPEGWCWATIDQIAEIQGGIQKQPSRTPLQNAFPYLRVANVLRNRLDLSVIEEMELFGNELDILRLEVGDLLIVEGNGSRTEIGRSAIWHGEVKDCVHQNHIIRVRPNHVLSEYLNQYWNSPDGSQRVMNVAASTTGLYTLNVSKIARLPVPLPPLSEQEQIVNEVEMQLSLIDHAEASIEDNLKQIEATRQRILEQAFAGELVEQDPNDEPASILLERIREERKMHGLEEQQRRKEERMNGAKNARGKRMLQKGRRPLQQVLIEAEQPMTPDALFRNAGLKADATEGSDEVIEFYTELREDIRDELVEEIRPDDTIVLLKATKAKDVNASL